MRRINFRPEIVAVCKVGYYPTRMKTKSDPLESSAASTPYRETTRDITIAVTPKYLPDQSDPARSYYAFAYTVEIDNHGNETVQLQSRTWLVFSGGTLFTEVKGEGVVGEQPVLGPKEHFEYTSSCVIKDPIGSMKGSYSFVTEDGSPFEAVIPEFDLVYPLCIN